MPRRSVGLPLPFRRILVLAGLLVASSAAVLHAQIDPVPTNDQGLSRPGMPQNGNEENGPFRDNPQLRERLERSRAADRQRRIVDDANRLVALTAQYRTALEAHGAPTGDDQKLLAQIEKLAREVKDRMRGM